MKRVGIIMLFLVMLFASLGSATAATPKPVSILSPEDIPPVLEGQRHVLLLCTDVWHGNPKNLGNTDGMVLVTLDTAAQRVMLTSLIRDALVQRPDGKIGRINYIAKNDSPEALCQVISRHIGVKIEQYILFDFMQISRIVDFLGGVDITITDEEAHYLTHYVIPPESTSPAITGAGTYRFFGYGAVIYMRIRKAGGGGDFMRTQRVRTVLSTLADQCRSISYEQARALLDSVMANTTVTNMSVEDMVKALDDAYSLRGCIVEELRLPVDGAVSPIRYAGMAAQQVDWEKCRAAMAHYLESSFLVMDSKE